MLNIIDTPTVLGQASLMARKQLGLTQPQLALVAGGCALCGGVRSGQADAAPVAYPARAARLGWHAGGAGFADCA